MTKVIHLPGSNASAPVQTSAHPATTTTTLRAQPDQVTRQQAIENALAMALFFIRQPGSDPANVWAATARANRALTLLKQVSQGNAPVSPSNALGRA